MLKNALTVIIVGLLTFGFFSGMARTDDYHPTSTQSSTHSALSVTLLSPIGGEILYVSSNYSLSWVTSGGIEPIYATLFYTVQGINGSYAKIASNLNASIGFFIWQVPDMPSLWCYIKINVSDSSSNGTQTTEDMTDDAFTIRSYPPSPGVRVIYPVRYEVLTRDYQYTLRWERREGLSLFITKIEYSIDSKVNFIIITQNATDDGLNSQYNWLVPNIISPNCYIRVTVIDHINRTGVCESEKFQIGTPLVLTGNIEGWIQNTQGKPIVGIKVYLKEKSQYHVDTNNDGYFLIGNISCGNYTVIIEGNSYSIGTTVKGVRVTPNNVTNIGHITLDEKPPPPPPPPPVWLLLLVIFIIIILIAFYKKIKSTKK